jgi:hypothetical protein
MGNTATVQVPCRTCGETYEAPDPGPALENLQAWTDAQNTHVSAHPDRLKTGMAPVPVKRDWVGDRSGYGRNRRER